MYSCSLDTEIIQSSRILYWIVFSISFFDIFTTIRKQLKASDRSSLLGALKIRYLTVSFVLLFENEVAAALAEAGEICTESAVCQCLE